MKKIYIIDIDTHLVSWTLYVNDIAVNGNSNHNLQKAQMPINEWLVPGENSIRLSVAINPKASEPLQVVPSAIGADTITANAFVNHKNTEINWKVYKAKGDSFKLEKEGTGNLFSYEVRGTGQTTKSLFKFPDLFKKNNEEKFLKYQFVAECNNKEQSVDVKWST